MDTSLRSLIPDATKSLRVPGSPPKLTNSKDICSPGFKKYLTKDKELLKDADYANVINLIENFWNLGVVHRGAGYCLSIADTLSKVLKANGVDCELMECELIITTDNPPSINMVGQDCNPVVNDAQINSHVVCVTKTKIPMLIDLSIVDYEKLTSIAFICERLNPTEKADLSEFNRESVSYFYNKKISSAIPQMHQKSILERIQTDRQIFSHISKIYLLLYIAIGISSMNFIRGSYDFYAKYINKTNGFGPQKSPYVISPNPKSLK